MRLNSLHLCNFRQHHDTKIGFDSGLTGIIGPNGAGKSTILEAIAWALYGQAAARGTRDSIRSLRAGPRASVKVELDFDLGGHRYRVVRGLTGAELYLDGAGAPIANTISGVNDLLRRRIGMSRDEFFNTYFTGQKELSVMAAMGPSERAQFLSRVLGYERLRVAQLLVRDRRKSIVAEINGLRTALPDADSVSRVMREAEERLSDATTRSAAAQERADTAREAHDAIAPLWEEVQRERQRMLEVESELRLADSECAGATREMERLGGELALARRAAEELERLTGELRPLPTIRAELALLDQLAREDGRRQALQEAARAAGEELQRLGLRLGQLSGSEKRAAATGEELERRRTEGERLDSAFELRRTEWVRDRQEAETKRQALREQYTELRAQRERLVAAGEEGSCPTCARPLGGYFRSVLDLIDEQIETVRVDGGYFRNRIEQLAETPEDLVHLEAGRRGALDEVARLERTLAQLQLQGQEASRLRREVAEKDERRRAMTAELEATPHSYDPERHRIVQETVARLQPVEVRAGALRSQLERLPEVERQRAAAEQRVAELQRRCEELRAARAEMTISDESVADTRRQFDSASAELHSAELNLVAARSGADAAARARDAAVRNEQELARARLQLETLEHERRLHDELDRSYADLRTDLNQSLRPELAEVASRLMIELTDGRYGELELDDQYNIVILEDGIPKPVISGGEEDLANLVLRLAISQMIADRAGQNFSLLILDEIFGSLDEARRHNVVDLLRRLHDRFDQVVLITHIDSVREGLDQVVLVRYDEDSGSSVVERAAPEGLDAEAALAVLEGASLEGVL
jgi:DNA repair protein SbcC/Rad50